jgi:hypothetical protein
MIEVKRSKTTTVSGNLDEGTRFDGLDMAVMLSNFKAISNYKFLQQ